MQSKKIGLSMIVKNESHVITRVLKSVLPLIDYWVVVDTGSTDGTQDLVKNFFAEHNIPGELIESEWKDFSTARNISLNAVEPHVDYAIWIDADEELIIEPGFNKADIFKDDADSISLRTVYGKVDYTRKNIWKTGKKFRWDGPIHELLNSPEEFKGAVASNLHVIVRPEGSSWKNIAEKYLAHAKILEEYTKVNFDTRWIFYTAQSYRDASQYDKSIEWYRKRASIPTGFYEEIYISRFMVARLSEGLGKSKQECTTLYQEAHSVDPVRGEAIKSLIQMYQRLNDWENAYVFSLYGVRYHNKNPYPNRILFLDKSLYDYEMLELHSLSCYYTKRYEEGSRCYWAMRNKLKEMGDSYLTEEQKKKVIDNEKYFPIPQDTIKPAPMKSPTIIRGSSYNPSKKNRKKKKH